ncbi:MAG: nuclease A inhibitor family protein [Abitibacteriaceae bacterium]|nr:nuclease A inhibitor family protein [Abditibacteriaceae bacterium]
MDQNLLTQLQQATQGLSFQSESDAPIEPFTVSESEATVSPETVLKAGHYPAGTKVKSTSLQTFFKNAMQMQDWFNDEEKQAAQRFQNLVQLLKDNLKGVKVFKVGETEQDVYVLGTTQDGSVAGVKTKVVET